MLYAGDTAFGYAPAALVDDQGLNDRWKPIAVRCCGSLNLRFATRYRCSSGPMYGSRKRTGNHFGRISSVCSAWRLPASGCARISSAPWCLSEWPEAAVIWRKETKLMDRRGGDAHGDGAVFLSAVFLGWAFDSPAVFGGIMAVLPMKIGFRFFRSR